MTGGAARVPAAAAVAASKAITNETRTRPPLQRAHASEDPSPTLFAHRVCVLSSGRTASGGRSAWQKEWHPDLGSIRDQPLPGQHRIIFLETPPLDSQAETQRLSEKTGIPPSFWDCLHQEANGYFAAHEDRDNDDKLLCLNTELRHLCKINKTTSKAPVKKTAGVEYAWEKFGFYTTWQRSGAYTMLCFDLPKATRASLINKIQAAPQHNLTHPFEYHHHLLAIMAEKFDEAVWQWRDIVRELEILRPRSDDPTSSKPDYIKMHELSRHTTHCTESLATALEVLKTMRECFQKLQLEADQIRDSDQMSRDVVSSLSSRHSLTSSTVAASMSYGSLNTVDESATSIDGSPDVGLRQQSYQEAQSSPTFQSLKSERDADDRTIYRKTCNTRAIENGLAKQYTLLLCLHNRSKALEQRLASEISLVFHINSASIAKSAKEDSEITKTIAFLGLLFLPGTLISAIFSTSFFNFTPGDGDTPDRWLVSGHFWIYWVTTGIVTFFTLSGWLIWRRWPDIKSYWQKRKQPAIEMQASAQGEDAIHEKVILFKHFTWPSLREKGGKTLSDSSV